MQHLPTLNNEFSGSTHIDHIHTHTHNRAESGGLLCIGRGYWTYDSPNMTRDCESTSHRADAVIVTSPLPPSLPCTHSTTGLSQQECLRLCVCKLLQPLKLGPGRLTWGHRNTQRDQVGGNVVSHRITSPASCPLFLLTSNRT